MNTKFSPPSISVIMASYNSANYIAEALDSILSQSFGDFEIIVIDDSTDNTTDIVRGYTDPRIRLTHNDRKVGISNARNMGIAEARGEFIAFHDADDVSWPGRFQKQWFFFRQNPGVALLGGQVEMQYADGKREMVSKRKLKPSLNQLMNKNCFATSSVMVRGDAFREVGGFNPALDCAEDWELWIRVAKKFTVANLPDTLYTYRVTSDGITSREHRNIGLWNSLVVDIAHDSVSDEVFDLIVQQGIATYTPASKAAQICFHMEYYHHNKNARKFNSALQHCFALRNLHGFDWGNTKKMLKTRLKIMAGKSND